MINPIRRIAICTGGGDAPGLNAVIRAAVISAMDRGWECCGIHEGFNGIFFPKRYADGCVFRLTRDRVRRITHLGGMGEVVARALQARTGKETRVVVLGHLLRGGSPTTFDRLAALRFGAAAVRALEAGQSGIMVALAATGVHYVPLEDVAGRMRCVPLDGDTVQPRRRRVLDTSIRNIEPQSLSARGRKSGQGQYLILATERSSSGVEVPKPKNSR